MRTLMLLLLVFLFGCPSKSSTEQPLDGTAWTLVQYGDSAGTSSSVTYPHGKSGNGYWVEFQKDTIAGKDNCNHFSGRHTIDGNTIATSNIMSTLIGCPDNLPMIAALTRATRYEFIDSRLYLYTTHPELMVLVFEKIP